MTELLVVLDVLMISAALLSAWLWWAASRSRLRRVSRFEVLDAADMNRLVTAMNRAQILNSRAALATAAAAILAAARLAVGALALGLTGRRLG